MTIKASRKLGFSAAMVLQDKAQPVSGFGHSLLNRRRTSFAVAAKEPTYLLKALPRGLRSQLARFIPNTAAIARTPPGTGKVEYRA
jgi:hypothetical protein